MSQSLHRCLDVCADSGCCLQSLWSLLLDRCVILHLLAFTHAVCSVCAIAFAEEVARIASMQSSMAAGDSSLLVGRGSLLGGGNGMFGKPGSGGKPDFDLGGGLKVSIERKKGRQRVACGPGWVSF